MNIQNQSSIANRIEKVRLKIRQCERVAAKPAGSVQMLAVSKTCDVAAIRQALAAGCQHFGESYVQEAIEKILSLNNEKLTWHFIGPIQSNKTRLIAQHFHWVHSVDRLKIAQRLNEHRPPHLAALQICVQVNISGESHKSGLAGNEVEALIQQIKLLPRLQIRGLMTVPRKSDSSEMQRHCFAQLRQLQERLNSQGAELDTLSMGMSNDLQLAIDEGASIVRVGSAIFGPRDV